MIIPTDGMLITADTVLAPGVYVLPQGISIAADGVTLDGNGALLLGAERQGRGVSVAGRNGVTIRNLRLQAYEHGIYARRCQGLTIRDCVVTATAELPPNGVFLDIWLPAARAYGGGILLWEVRDSRIEHNDLQHQMNGLLCYGCDRLHVRGNVANYCSGFGFHFFQTSDSLVEGNCADFCCRYHRRADGATHMGADAAGFLIAHGSCRNTFRRNLARMGGDGFFLAGLTPQWQHVGCDENLFEGNDGSYSPNIAFEATFSRGNVYRDNTANHCNYGFWLGFSSEGVLEGNEMRHNAQAGIAVENGYGFEVRGNRFDSNGHGVLLWSKYVDAFAMALPQNDTSRDWRVERNVFTRNGTAIRIAADQDHGIRDLPAPQRRCPRPHSHHIRKNTIEANRIGIETVNVERSVIERNDLFGNLAADVREV